MVASVVEIELANHLVASEAQETSQRIAHRRMPAVRKMERPRRVGRKILDTDLGRELGLSPAPPALGLPDVEQPVLPESIGEAQIHEARPRDRHFR